MYTRVSSPQDPITFAETNSVWTNAMNSNNIAYRNMTIVDLASSKSVSFLVRNTNKETADLDVVIDIPPKYLEKGEVHMMLTPELDKAWPKKNRAIQGIEILKNRHYIQRDVETEMNIQPDTKSAKKPVKEQKARLHPVETKLPIYRVSASKLVLKDLRMKGRQAEKMMLTFSSKDTAKTVTEIHVTQTSGGKAKDGILFIVRTGYGKKR
jgi:hypothetical protein